MRTIHISTFKTFLVSCLLHNIHKPAEGNPIKHNMLIRDYLIQMCIFALHMNSV